MNSANPTRKTKEQRPETLRIFLEKKNDDFFKHFGEKRLSSFVNIYTKPLFSFLNCISFTLSISSLMFFLCSLLSIHIVVEMTIFYVKTKRNCFLFARIFAKERFLVPGPVGICEVFLFVEYSIVVLGYAVAKVSSQFRGHSRFTIWLCSVWMVALGTATMFSLGYKATCDSLVSRSVPECSREVFNNLDWKSFRPKYVLGYNMPGHFERIQISLWSVVLLWFISTVLHVMQIGNQSRSPLKSPQMKTNLM